MTFTGWLRDQLHRKDPVGDLARDWLIDPSSPPEPLTLERMLEHIQGGVEFCYPGCRGPVCLTVRAAWKEFATAEVLTKHRGTFSKLAKGGGDST